MKKQDRRILYVIGILAVGGLAYFLVSSQNTSTPVVSQIPTPTASQTPTEKVLPTQIMTAPIVKDTTPPKVYILEPLNNSKIQSGMVKIVANVTDDTKVERVEFFIGPENTSIKTLFAAPYEYLWDTTRYMNGHNIPIEVRAYDSSGNKSYQMINVDPQR